jgi:hypothetical protein
MVKFKIDREIYYRLNAITAKENLQLIILMFAKALRSAEKLSSISGTSLRTKNKYI